MKFLKRISIANAVVSTVGDGDYPHVNVLHNAVSHDDWLEISACTLTVSCPFILVDTVALK